MSNFRFRLETLLKLRRAALDQQRAKLAEAYRAEAILREHEEEIARQAAEAHQDRRNAAGRGTVNVDAALRAQRFDLLLLAQRQALDEQRRKLSAAIEQQRRLVVEADRDVKVLEKLRERRQAEHAAAEQVRDMKQLDEIAARTRKEAP
jgi:flagellar FliJ protein